MSDLDPCPSARRDIRGFLGACSASRCLRRRPPSLRRPAAEAGPVLALVCGLLAITAFPGAAFAENRCDGAAPLRIANLSPFHIPYRVPASFGACVLPPVASEVIAALDLASHLDTAASATERLSIDGETWRPSLTVRRGLAEGWEYWFELSAVSHNRGVFDGFIETWHDVFGLPQGGRDSAPRDRLAIAYARDGTVRKAIGIVGVVALLCGGAAAEDRSALEELHAEHMVAEAMLTAHFVAAALKAGMGKDEIDAVLAGVAERSAVTEFRVSDEKGPGGVHQRRGDRVRLPRRSQGGHAGRAVCRAARRFLAGRGSTGPPARTRRQDLQVCRHRQGRSAADRPGGDLPPRSRQAPIGSPCTGRPGCPPGH